MKASKLIEILQEAQMNYGDLPIHFVGGVSEFSPSKVVLAKAGVSAAHAGAVTGSHQFEPARLVIKGQPLS